MNFHNILFDSTEAVSRPVQPGSSIFFLLKALFSIQVMKFCFLWGLAMKFRVLSTSGQGLNVHKIFFFHGRWRKNLQACFQKYSCRNVAFDDFDP